MTSAWDDRDSLLQSLPGTLAGAAPDLKGEVAVSGRVKFLEVQNAEELRKEVQEPLTPEDEQELDRMGI